MKETSQQEENSRLLAAIEGEIDQLRQDLVGLHEKLGRILEEMSQASDSVPDFGIALAPAAPRPPLLSRALARIRRMAARTLRGAVSLLHPCQERIRALDFREMQGSLELPAVEDLNCLGDTTEAGLLEDLRWLFALESVDAARVGDTLVLRPGEASGIPISPGPELLESVESAGRPLVIRELDAPPENSIETKMLHPEGLGEVPARFGGGAYSVALPASTRKATLQLGLHGVESPAESRKFPWALLLGRELVCGLEHRVFSALRTLGPGLVISSVETSLLGRRRLRELEDLGCETHDFGNVLHAAVRPGAALSALSFSGAAGLWALGGEELDAALSLIRGERPELRIFREDPEKRGLSVGSESGIVLRPASGKDIFLPTPAAEPRGFFGKERGAADGIRRLLIIDDLVAEARPEDAVLLADEFRRGGDSLRLVWVGEGPLVSRVDELRRLFGLENFQLISPAAFDLSQGAADLLCVLGESPYLPPAAAVAAQTGLPLLSVRGNELENFGDSESISFAGAPGDISSMARAVRDFSPGLRGGPLRLPAEEDFGEKLRRLLIG